MAKEFYKDIKAITPLFNKMSYTYKTIPRRSSMLLNAQKSADLKQ